MFLRNHWKVEVGECHNLKDPSGFWKEAGWLGARAEAEKPVRKQLQSPSKRWWPSE